ncbi:MAG: MerC domain-containing protein [Flavobacteriaceae bacterium]
MRLTTKNSDYLGAISGVLCIIHCIITPLLFLINAELATKQTLLTLQVTGYVFLIISFFAVYKSALNTTNNIVKVLFFVFWSFLLFLILNESFGVFRIAETFTFISAFSLSALHIYNLKYCQCKDENCCVSDQ